MMAFAAHAANPNESGVWFNLSCTAQPHRHHTNALGSQLWVPHWQEFPTDNKNTQKMEPNQYLYWLDIGQPAIVSPFSISICVETILEVSVTARATNPIN